MSAHADPLPLEDRVREQQSALLFANVGISQLVSIVNASILAGATVLMSGLSPTVITWHLLTLLVALLRWGIAQRYRQDPARRTNAAKWTRYFLWGSIAAGLTWGLGGAILSYHAEQTQRFFTGLVILGMVAGAVPLLSPRLETFRGYAYPAVLFPCVFSFVEGGSGLVWLYGFLAIVFLTAMDRSATLSHQNLIESIRLRIQAEEHAADLEQARAAAEAASVAKSRLLANMSHELRTPLNGVLGFGTLLESTELSEEQKEYVAMLRLSGEQLLQLITDVLDLSQLEAGMVKVAAEPVQLIALLDHLLERHQAKAKQKGLRLNLSWDSALASDLVGDQGKLQQLLGHLTDNAIKFTERGQVDVALKVLETTPSAQRIAFSVNDSGIGIAPERQAEIFQIFTQADDSSTRRYGGSGLGLAICRKLVDLLGGEIRVDSQPGQGSRFTFILSLQRHQGSIAP
ncbi:hypothetical protein DLREEDagrD3_00880 [Denitratisoma sp. agr-D3]